MKTEQVIYHADGVTGEYIGTGFADPDPRDEGRWLIPASAYTERPPECQQGYVAIINDGVWQKVRDYRGVIYSTQDGAPQQHSTLGELPVGYTDQPRPGPCYVWTDGQWTLDENALAALQQTAERQWRDARIESINWLRERHRDQQELALTTTLSAQQFAELLAYMQQLRDWPQSQKFPEIEHRPTVPSWIADQAN